MSQVVGGNGVIMKIKVGVGIAVISALALGVVDGYLNHVSAEELEKVDKKVENTKQVVVEIDKKISNIDTALKILLKDYGKASRSGG